MAGNIAGFISVSTVLCVLFVFHDNGLPKCLRSFVVCLIRAELCTAPCKQKPSVPSCKNVKGLIWAGSKPWLWAELGFWGSALWLRNVNLCLLALKYDNYM